MARIVMKPRWKQLHHLKQKPYIHFNLETFGSKYMIPSDFRNSFHLLPEDKYINQTGAITRSRKYANIVVDVSNNYEYEVKLTNNTIFTSRYNKKTPLKRIGKSSDVASSVVFLASKGSDYITGINLVIDGGMTIL